jgi:hypothetical protein
MLGKVRGTPEMLGKLSGLAVPGPVDKKGFALNPVAFHKTPVTAVLAVIPVVAKGEIVILVDGKGFHRVI